MENNPTEKTEQTIEVNEDNAIVVESVEDDMRSHGIDVQEPSQEEEEENPEASKTPGKEDEQQKPAKKSRAQRKIERQARELRAKEEEIERLKKAAGQGSSQDNGKEDGVDNPNDIDPDDFETWAEYRDAVRKAEEVANTKAAATDTKEREEEEAPDNGLSKELNERIQVMTEDGQEDYENFDEVVRNPELPLTEKMLDVITQSEQSADIAYFLGTNLERARKLAAMDSRAMAKEVLRIEIELEQKPNKVVRVTKAPDPINPVHGGNSAKGKTLDDADLSYEEHEALLLKKSQPSRGGFL